MAKYLVDSIIYDTDGEDVELPKCLEISIPSSIVENDAIIEKLGDEISNITGFCHHSFSYKKVTN